MFSSVYARMLSDQVTQVKKISNRLFPIGLEFTDNLQNTYY